MSPFPDLRTRTPQYLGPGREVPLPENLTEIAVAFFGPDDPQHPDFGEAWRGAALAIEQANASGGYHGLPFRLVSAWSDNPWTGGVRALARLTYTQNVWAVLGGIDGGSTHLAEQVAVKARVPLVNPGGTDPSVHFTNIPWMFTLIPTDDQIAPVLADAVCAQPANVPWAVVTTTDRDARVAWRAVERVLAARQAPTPVLRLALPTRAPDYARALPDIVGSSARAVLLLADARDTANLVRALRAAGFSGRIVAGASAGRRVFGREAGADAEGILFPLLFDADSPDVAAFVQRYAARWGEPPDFLAAHAHDAARLLMDAVLHTGPNRALIRDALAALAPWVGVTGSVTWDPTGRNVRPVACGTWQGGRVCPAPGNAARSSREQR